MIKIFRFSLTIILLFLSTYCFALEQSERAWFAVNSQQTLSKDKKWLSYIYSQARLVNQDHPWQTVLLEGGIGYRTLNQSSYWFGYRWSGRNPYNDFFQENRLFQQVIRPIQMTQIQQMILRTRLEEIQRTNQNQISLRLRQRIAFEFHALASINKLSPLVYDELFFQLNKTDYTSQQLVSENRVFLGFNYYHKENSWWEIGYVSQYHVHTPQNPQNQLNHIVSVTYNFK